MPPGSLSRCLEETASWPSRWRTTAAGSTRPRHLWGRASRTWPTALPLWVVRSRCGLDPAKARPSRAGFRSGPTRAVWFDAESGLTEHVGEGACRGTALHIRQLGRETGEGDGLHRGMARLRGVDPSRGGDPEREAPSRLRRSTPCPELRALGQPREHRAVEVAPRVPRTHREDA